MLNHLTLIGHIGQDAQCRQLQAGRFVTSFSVAHTESWRNDAGEKQERTTWFSCSYFTQTQPGVLDYLRKGAIVCIQGKVSARAYLDRNNHAAASLDVNVDTIRLISTPKRDEPINTTVPGYPGNVPTPPADQNETVNPAGGDDLPF